MNIIKQQNVNIETYLKYDPCIITIDNEDNVIDNILYKRYDIREEVNYYIR